MTNKRRTARTAHRRPLTMLHPSAGDADGCATDEPDAPGGKGPARSVICELDADGELDGHAAMCLRFAVEDLLAHGATEILLDVRDLTAVDQDAIALLQRVQRLCSAGGARLDLLIDGRRVHGDAAHVLRHAGLAVTPHLAPQRPTRRARSRSWPRSTVNPDSRGQAANET